MFFRDIPGHSGVKKELTTMARQGRLPHTMLIHGRRGTGSLAMARALAAYIVCREPSDEDACGECGGCRKMKKLQYPDCHLFYPLTSIPKDKFEIQYPGTQQTFRKFCFEYPFGTLSEWLDVLVAERKQLDISKNVIVQISRSLSMKSFEGGPSVVIIWLPEYLGHEGNRLLKLFEEPPPGSYIIMVAEETEKILSTILSRTQQFFLPPYQDYEIEQALRASCVDDQTAEQATFLAHGNLQKAMLISQQKETDPSALWLSMLSASIKEDATNIQELSQKLADLTREDLKLLVEFILDFISECHSAVYRGEEHVRLRGRTRNAAIHLGRNLSVESMEMLAMLTNHVRRAIESNPNVKVLLLTYLIDLSHVVKNNLTAVQFKAVQHK